MCSPHHSWLGVLRCVWWFALSARTPPSLVGACGMWVRIRVLAFTPPFHGWGVGMCVFVCALRLYPASPGWGVRCGCVLGIGSWLRPAIPCLGVGVRVLVCALPLHPATPESGLWCAGLVLHDTFPVPWFVACCVCFPGLRHPVAVVAWHLSPCLCYGPRLSIWRASWPRMLRRASSGLVAPGAPVCFSVAVVPSPTGGFCLRNYWVAAPGTWRRAENRALCACLCALPRQGRRGRSPSYPFGAQRWGCPWRVPLVSVLGCVRCGGLAYLDPVAHASGFPYCPSFDGVLGRCSGAVSCGRPNLTFQVGGRHARVLCVSACAGSCWPGRLGRPPRSVFVRITFPVAVVRACFVILCPLRAGGALFLFVSFFRSQFLFFFFPPLLSLACSLSFAFSLAHLPPPRGPFCFCFLFCAPALHFFSSLSLSVLLSCAPASCPPPPPRSFVFLLVFFVPSYCFVNLLFLCFFSGGGLLPRACVLPRLLALRCCVPCCSFSWHEFPCCGASCGAGAPLPPLGVALVVCGVFGTGSPVLLRVPVSCCVVLSPVVWSALCCVCCRAVLCWCACVLLFCAVVPCVVPLLAVLHVACCAGFVVLALCGSCVACCSVRCCALLLSVVRGVQYRAALVSRCLVVCSAASCCAVVLSCLVACGCALCCFPWSLAVPVCGGLGPFCVVVCFILLCFVVRFVAVLLSYVALSSVLAPCPWVWRCGALRRRLWCVVMFLLVLYLVACLLRCCGVLCWHACVVLACAVFCCVLVVCWCLVLLPVYWGSAGRPGCLVLTRSRGGPATGRCGDTHR